MDPKFAVFGNKSSTRILVEYLTTYGFKPSCVITLDSTKKKKIPISGVDFRLVDYCKSQNIKVFHPSSYNLKSVNDLKYFQKESFEEHLIRCPDRSRSNCLSGSQA